MKKLVLILMLMNSALAVHAQTAEDSVKTVVQTLFMAMKNSDPVLLRTVFADSAVLQTIAKNKAGETIVRNEILTVFLESISKLPVGAADEQISFAQLNIDGDLASVWTPYKFFFNGNFSHCGVNSFQLLRFDDGWKIQYLIDTRRRSGCE